MKMFNIDNATALNLKVIKDSEYWYCILGDYNLTSFKVGVEVMFASGRMGQVIFDTVESVDIENQIVTLKEYGPVKLTQWEYFARV